MARPYLIFKNLRIRIFCYLQIGVFGGVGGRDYGAEIGFGETGEVVAGDDA